MMTHDYDVKSFLKNNIANILTVSRLLLLPLIIALFYLEGLLGGFAMWACLALYAIASVTDFFDGYAARKLNQISAFGTFLDPISDKIFVATMFLLFVAFGKISGIWILCVVVIFAREFLISGLREFLAPQNIAMPVTNLAKWKTTAQMVCIGVLIMSGYVPYATLVGLTLLVIATGLTVYTGLGYMRVGFTALKED